jgi:uncharacterized Ntn-hydrolase superfamily protein
MSTDIPERDWKYLRSIHKALLDRLCRRILGEIQAEIARGGDGRTAHETYLAVYKRVERSDRVIGDCIDDWRRSTILARLFSLLDQDLLSAEEEGHLSEETREKIRWWREMAGRKAPRNEA